MADDVSSADATEVANYVILSDIRELLEKESLREIGHQAVWSVSSCKQGYGVNSLRDNSLETYWQSDGTQPHMVNVQFKQKTTIHSVGVYTDYKADESYTPSRLSVSVGNDFNDLSEVEQVEVNEPSGWVWIKLPNQVGDKPIRTFMAQISVLQNHQNGRDTHMRQIKVFASTKDTTSIDYMISGCRLPMFSSVEAAMFSTIR
ncbi:anaphase-promoting complex subunit 10-like isoform X1 [Ciona intestinalis]|uniref:Anaphase-promoting complex subunit 10 n=1 Tax=Ciona intestinalis TaxID=7719 RepID=F7BB49_CIOIN|nr:anaphase-promoting complex subunit 10-like [Ciona intestinalis]|eukprot:XP_002131938.1 anaphase-promoting complex subunit 10-like [Ciona intestinalis]